MDETALPNDDSHEAMLNELEARVLGCLMEKQMTTPDYYPLTLNALVAACNQKSSRTPAMNLQQRQVGAVVTTLRGRGLVTARMERAERFEQHLTRKLSLSIQERAVICVMLLRGAQTLNEIRVRTSRMTDFESAEALLDVIHALTQRQEPLIVQLPCTPGQREDRYTHLLCGKPKIDHTASPAQITAVETDPEANERIAALEQIVAALQEDLRLLWKLSGLQKPDQ
jgi:uncharacterized protein YceH (UPF0502 family)